MSFCSASRGIRMGWRLFITAPLNIATLMELPDLLAPPSPITPSSKQNKPAANNQEMIDQMEIDTDKFPPGFICNIAAILMTEPVKINNTYCDFLTLLKCIKAKEENPYTREKLTINDLTRKHIIDKKLQKQIKEYTKPLWKLYNGGHILSNHYFPKSPCVFFTDKDTQKKANEKINSVESSSNFNKPQDVNEKKENDDANTTFMGLKLGFLNKM